MGLSFIGQFDQKVDGKGRMSIPADFRRVLEAGDPDFPEKNPNPRIVVLFGEHLKNCLHAYTISDMAGIVDEIRALPRGSDRKKQASKLIISKAWSTEVDRDGRIVLPKARREQIGLEGSATMSAMGDYFEIWNAATYEAEEGAETTEFLAKQPENYDPLSLLDDVREG